MNSANRSGVLRPGPLGVVLAAAFTPTLFIWLIWFPLAGYNSLTVTLAQMLIFAVGLGLIAAPGLVRLRGGLASRELWQAAWVCTAAYALLLLLGLVLNRLGIMDGPLLRSRYTLMGLWDNWLLTGLGEELVFAGALFPVVADRLGVRRRWLAVVIVALLFALWHLPGHTIQGRRDAELVLRLALNFVSWGFIGLIYFLSGNLWLAAFAHASTDYPLSPLIKDVPALGLAFMLLLAAGGWWARDPHRVLRLRRGTADHEVRGDGS